MPQGWTGPVFRLSQDYPTQTPPKENWPWLAYDIQREWRQYLQALLHHCYEGNIEAGWVIQENRVRRWYHAPWLHYGRNGREFIHGLTHERPSQPEELARTQTALVQNWAVGFYNPPGGYTIGKVWKNPNAPDIENVRFPVGTVSCKLIFTQATPEQVPYLKGSVEWQANIYTSISIPTNPNMPRAPQTLRLLQIDVAARDPRVDKTGGWVLGTFVYNGDAPGHTPWDRVVPVGLAWGNDPGLTSVDLAAGRVPTETLLNASAEVPPQHYGWGRRLNGPVDNPASACTSCHATAQWTLNPKTKLSPLVAPKEVQTGSQEWMRWFRNLPVGTAFDGDREPGARSLDFSLQLAIGLANWNDWRQTTASLGGYFNAVAAPQAQTFATPAPD